MALPDRPNGAFGGGTDRAPPSAMRQELWLSGLVFHLVFATACVIVARRWGRRLRSDDRGAWPGAALADGGLLLAIAVTAAGVGTVLGAHSGFTIVRLLAQGLFGEMIALGVVLTALVVRSARRPAAGALMGLLPLGLLAVYGEAYHREPTDLRVERHTVAARAAGDGRLTILHISDVQMDHVGPYERRVLETALAQRADLIVLTGDYVQPRAGGSRERATADLNALLRRRPFQAPLGAYAVEGDVDPDWPRVLEGTNILPLSGEAARRPLPGGRFLSLLGLTPRMSHGLDPDGVERLVRSVPPGDLSVVIGHGPDFVMTLPAAEVDLAMAGHTHGGQVVVRLLRPAPHQDALVARARPRPLVVPGSAAARFRGDWYGARHGAPDPVPLPAGDLPGRAALLKGKAASR